ncbi:uncharacterized protein LOC142988137 [Genypterus blacodes]|uniref:uncharacterized protein LOC142988137 n=1 Tax=Genypterus blacodes TaxID=154954 RepID=UPI003F75A247
MLLYLFVLWAQFRGLMAADSISPVEAEVSGTEGQSVTLSCSYQTDQGTVDLYWYRHHPNQAPQFILWKRGRGGTNVFIPDKRYESRTSRNSTDLTLTEVTVADTAHYYCALRHSDRKYRRGWCPSSGEGEIQGGAELLLNSRRETNFHLQLCSIHKAEASPFFNMLSVHCCVFPLLCLHILTGVSCEELTAVREGKEEFSLEGSTVTLSYNYSRAATGDDYFFWYRQNPGNPPQFLILISGSNFVKSSDSLKSDSRFSTKLYADKGGVDLLILSAAVTDSAVYYCAVKPTVTANPQALY